MGTEPILSGMGIVCGLAGVGVRALAGGIDFLRLATEETRPERLKKTEQETQNQKTRVIKYVVPRTPSPELHVSSRADSRHLDSNSAQFAFRSVPDRLFGRHSFLGSIG
jgi:hypothetical protein